MFTVYPAFFRSLIADFTTCGSREQSALSPCLVTQLIPVAAGSDASLSLLPTADGPFAPWRNKLLHFGQVAALHFGQVFTPLFVFTLFSTLCFEESSPLFFDSSLVSAMTFDSLCLSSLKRPDKPAEDFFCSCAVLFLLMPGKDFLFLHTDTLTYST